MLCCVVGLAFRGKYTQWSRQLHRSGQLSLELAGKTVSHALNLQLFLFLQHVLVVFLTFAVSAPPRGPVSQPLSPFMHHPVRPSPQPPGPT